MGLRLPPQRFFEPNKRFWEFIESTLWLRHRRLWDVGAGMGQLTDGLLEHLGLDTKHDREEQRSVE